jgi:hypothetical protein
MNLPDRLLAALSALIERHLARTDYHALYPCEVVAQHEDGSLELKPETDRFGAGLSRVPIRGLPGVKVKVKQKARVLLGFEGGAPRRPYAALWTADSLEELTVTASVKVVVKSPKVYLGDDQDAKPVARVGDVVECAMPVEVPVVGTLSGQPFAGLLTITDPVLGVIDSAGTGVFSK